MVSVTIIVCWILLFFFFKQKTAYEMRISDWSSDVCSSDLVITRRIRELEQEWDMERVLETNASSLALTTLALGVVKNRAFLLLTGGEIGRASCRERVCQYV